MIEFIMKKEIIECAAVNYDSRAIAFRAYVAGAEWRISVIWNDASEEPEDNKMILALDNNGFPIIVLAVSGKWEETVSSLKIKIWAYIEDLIPIDILPSLKEQDSVVIGNCLPRQVFRSLFPESMSRLLKYSVPH